MRHGSTYCFIDGEYMRKVHGETLRAIFGQEPDFCLDDLRGAGGMLAEKYFYYDCINDLKRPGDTDEGHQARLKSEDERMDAIRALPGFHVRLGSLSGQHKRRRQKQVDVLLAVDMLSHAHNKNMQNALLIAGDLDFKPVVEKLVSQHGTYVVVLHGRDSASKDLCWSADESHPLRPEQLYCCTRAAFKSSHPIPDCYQGSPVQGCVARRTGILNGLEAVLYELAGNTIEFFNSEGTRLACRCPDLVTLERYMEYEHGAVQWNEPSRW